VLERAVSGGGCGRALEGCGRALEQARSAVGDVFEQDLAAAVQQQAVEGRLVGILRDGSAGLCSTASAARQDFDGISGRVSQQEPVRRVDISN
jgi:hypothetical protein